MPKRTFSASSRTAWSTTYCYRYVRSRGATGGMEALPPKHERDGEVGVMLNRAVFGPLGAII